MSRERRRVTTPGGGEERTKQSFRDSVDINLIMKKHRAGQQVTHLRKDLPVYGDVSYSEDLKTSLDKINSAKTEFETLPSAVRETAQNNFIEMWEMLANPDGALQLQRAGLALGIEEPEKTEETSEKVVEEPTTD